MNFDPELCLSFKNKYSNTQCPHSRKFGEEFCGIHLKSKNIRRIDNPAHWISENNIASSVGTNIVSMPEKYNETKKNLEIKDDIKICENPIKKTKFNNSNCNDLLYIEAYTFFEGDITDKINEYQKYIQKINFFDNFRQLKDIMTYEKNLLNLNNMITNWNTNIRNEKLPKLIKVQSICRRWLARRRYLCNNKEDFFLLLDMYNIPNNYFFSIKDGNFNFGFEFRSFYNLSKKFDPKNNEIYNSNVDNIKNPFTNMLLSEENKKKYLKHLIYIKEKGLTLDFPKRKLTPDELLRNKLVDVFQKIDFLDNYTDISWFEELDLKGLKKLYTSCEDIFNYRCNFTNEIKKRIIHDGVIFNMNKNTLEKLTDKHKKFLQNMLLDDFNRLCTEGQNTDDRKLGAILILTALTEVSKKAAQALPHIAQSSYLSTN
jgi:hypothetical protein